jgi:hypothetical protein
MIKKPKTIKTFMLFLGWFFLSCLREKKRLFKISIFSQLKVQKKITTTRTMKEFLTCDIKKFLKHEVDDEIHFFIVLLLLLDYCLALSHHTHF